VMQRGAKNVALAGVLLGFVGGVYVWTTQRVKDTDLFAPVASELDEARALKKQGPTAVQPTEAHPR